MLKHAAKVKTAKSTAPPDSDETKAYSTEHGGVECDGDARA